MFVDSRPKDVPEKAYRDAVDLKVLQLDHVAHIRITEDGNQLCRAALGRDTDGTLQRAAVQLRKPGVVSTTEAE
jgi:hypothetical protein